MKLYIYTICIEFENIIEFKRLECNQIRYLNV